MTEFGQADPGEQGLIQADFTDSLDLAKKFVARHKMGTIEYHQTKGGAIEQTLERYFSGDLPALSELPVAPVGTDFSRQVWEQLCRIPAGSTKTYGEIANNLERPRAARAVGMACHNNPIGLVIPCHRVVGKSGSLTGYAGGLHIKEWLLSHEGVQVDSNRMQQINLFT